jgi:hypothetical protein
MDASYEIMSLFPRTESACIQKSDVILKVRDTRNRLPRIRLTEIAAITAQYTVQDIQVLTAARQNAAVTRWAVPQSHGDRRKVSPPKAARTGTQPANNGAGFALSFSAPSILILPSLPMTATRPASLPSRLHGVERCKATGQKL